MLYDGQYNSPGAPGGPGGVTVGARPVVNQQDIENFRKQNPGRGLQPRPGLPPTGPFTTVMGPPGAIGNEGGMIAHHMNPNVDAQGNVTAEGLSNARERQYEETGQPLGTGWGEPVNPNVNQSSNTQNAKPITARPMSSTAFAVGNQGGINPGLGGPITAGGNQEVAQLADGSDPQEENNKEGLIERLRNRKEDQENSFQRLLNM